MFGNASLTFAQDVLSVILIIAIFCVVVDVIVLDREYGFKFGGGGSGAVLSSGMYTTGAV